MGGFKRFYAEVALAKGSAETSHLNVRRGDCDGEFTFTFTHNALPTALDIQVLIPDVELYPKSLQLMIFSQADGGRKDVLSFLEDLPGSFAWKDVGTLISGISERLTAYLEAGGSDPAAQAPFLRETTEEATKETTKETTTELTRETTSPSTESSLDSKESLNDFLFYPRQQNIQQLSAESVQRLRRDLRAALSAGISVGIFPEGRLKAAETISLSVRATKLGVSEDVLEAWGIKSSDYIVLLCQYSDQYPSITELLKSQPRQKFAKFSLGKCAKYKPSTVMAKEFTESLPSFNPPPDDDGSETKEKTSGSVGDRSQSDSFIPLHISSSINVMLEEEFVALLKLRRRHRMSWDAAQTLLARTTPDSVGAHQAERVPAYHPATHTDPKTLDIPVSLNSHESLHHDYALDEDEDFNLSMTCLQFALRRLARCTQYCMICQQRLEKKFEALKPYVCPTPLCLYQHISLGLGTTIEAEIIDNPFVVDLLICFFYAAVIGKTLSDLPRGLNIKAPLIGDLKNMGEHIVAEACLSKRRVRFGLTNSAAYCRLKVGQSILIVVENKNDQSEAPIVNGTLVRYFCRITSMQENNCFLHILSTETQPLAQSMKRRLGQEVPTPELCSNWVKVFVFQFTVDFDKLDLETRGIWLMYIIRAVPSVLRIRAFLLQNPGRSLESWEGLDQNGLTLLRWIIASNGSLILQDGDVPHVGPDVTEDLDEPSNNQPTDIAQKGVLVERDMLKAAVSGMMRRLKPKGGPLKERTQNGSHDQSQELEDFNKIVGVPPDLMQFRFLQGSPEREMLFGKELRLLAESPNRKGRPETFFAWHGSRLRNWHSIIRTGLDFGKIENGRIFGNGVYFSSYLSYSAGYSGDDPSRSDFVGNVWPGSELRPQWAVSICELINRPEDFVATVPHYVVDKVEWIQCRYLMVTVRPTKEAMKEPLRQARRSCKGYVRQEAGRHLLSTIGDLVQIPLSALSTEWQRRVTTPGKSRLRGRLSGGKNREMGKAKEEEVEGSTEMRKRLQSPSSNSSTSDSCKLSNADHEAKMGSPDAETMAASRPTRMTDFVPGSLDPETIPKLPEPSWASPSCLRSLTRSVKEMQKIQAESDIGFLGWYIDFERLTNVYHWIVELHTFDQELPLAQDMKQKGVKSIVLEFRFGANFPFSPPFVRVIRPRFTPIFRGGGGHVTSGGAVCSEMLTNSGWSPAMTMEKVILQVRLGLTDLHPPARLETGLLGLRDYGIGEALDAYHRSAVAHGWRIPPDLNMMQRANWGNEET